MLLHLFIRQSPFFSLHLYESELCAIIQEGVFEYYSNYSYDNYVSGAQTIANNTSAPPSSLMEEQRSSPLNLEHRYLLFFILYRKKEMFKIFLS